MLQPVSRRRRLFMVAALTLVTTVFTHAGNTCLVTPFGFTFISDNAEGSVFDPILNLFGLHIGEEDDD